MKEIRSWSYRFTAAAEPVYHAKEGETLKFIAPDCFNGGMKEEETTISRLDLTQTNPAAGPVYIDGAEPGDVIGVTIEDVKVADHGVVCVLTDEGPLRSKVVDRTKVLDIHDGRVWFNDISWPLDPMIGVIGTAPADREVPTGWVFENGGNMDSRLIRKGVTVWLPVSVPGALLSMGDVHATMGDGECTATGVEVAAEMTVTIRLVKNCRINWPVTEMEDRWYVNTCGATCDEAIDAGYQEMHRLLEKAYGWDATDTAAYMSIQGYIEANQAVLVPNGGGNTFRIGTPKVEGKSGLIG